MISAAAADVNIDAATIVSSADNIGRIYRSFGKSGRDNIDNK